MPEVPNAYYFVLDAVQILIGIGLFYIIYRTHPCWRFFLFLHGLFTLDAFYIEGLSFAFSFLVVSFGILVLSFVYLRGKTGEKLNQLIDEKILKRFTAKN